jgi:hypothetical protein
MLLARRDAATPTKLSFCDHFFRSSLLLLLLLRGCEEVCCVL